jgi:hypothetical protein
VPHQPVAPAPPHPWDDLPAIAPADATAASRPWLGPLFRSGLLLVFAAYSVASGSVRRAQVLVVAAVAATLLAVFAPAASARLDAGIARLASWIGEGIGWIAAVAIEVVVVAPGRILTTLRRRDPLSGHRPGIPSTAWRARLVADDQPRRPYAGDVPGRTDSRTWVWVVPLTAFAAFAALTIDLDRGPVGPVLEVRPQVEALPDRPSLTGDGLKASPAMRRYGWLDDYARELDELRYDAKPYIVVQTRDRSGDLVNVEYHRRVGYEPEAGGRLPVVWLLGGSTAFGFGQRDGHTIASQLARRAEEAGRPIRVVNLGQPGVTAFQEALLFEQALAVLPEPDLAIFYDGANDIAVQTAYPSVQPTAFPETVDVGTLPGDRRSPVQHWADASFVAQMIPGRPGHVGKVRGGGVSVVPPKFRAEPADDVATKALGVYARSVGLATRTGRRFGVPVRFVFQPARFYASSPVARRFRADLPEHVVDLSHVLDARPEVSIDGLHVNEVGADLIAAHLYDELRSEPALRRKGG